MVDCNLALRKLFECLEVSCFSLSLGAADKVCWMKCFALSIGMIWSNSNITPQMGGNNPPCSVFSSDRLLLNLPLLFYKTHSVGQPF
mgnify:CR=1 FL=1